MKSFEFIIWLKGFMEACNDYTATPKQWDRIKEVLNEVQDYDDNPGIDVEIDDWFTKKVNLEPNGTSPLRYTGTVGTTGYVSTTTANSFSNTEKQQLND
jgi:hypothetical protein